MSYNLSPTLFYEYHKSDPNLINASIEEYRNYKSDPQFSNKTLEQYKRAKVPLMMERSLSTQGSISEVIKNSDENNEIVSTNEGQINLSTENQNCDIKIDTTIEHQIEKEIKSENDNEIHEVNEKESDNESLSFEDSILEQQEFAQSLEQLQKWNLEDEAGKCASENKPSKKNRKSKFKIPKYSSKPKFANVKSRYMEIYTKNKESPSLTS